MSPFLRVALTITGMICAGASSFFALEISSCEFGSPGFLLKMLPTAFGIIGGGLVAYALTAEEDDDSDESEESA